MSFERIFDLCDGSYSLKQPFEEEDHLLVLIGVYTSVIVKDIEADCHHNV